MKDPGFPGSNDLRNARKAVKCRRVLNPVAIYLELSTIIVASGGPVAARLTGIRSQM